MTCPKCAELRRAVTAERQAHNNTLKKLAPLAKRVASAERRARYWRDKVALAEAGVDYREGIHGGRAMKKNCGTCRWWKRERGGCGLGDCIWWMLTGPLPDSFTRHRRMDHDGTTCPCWERKP